MAGEHILIVDDNPANLKLVQFILSASGYRVRTAESADAAMAAIAEDTPDLILMDIQLPGTDGLTLTRQLLGNPSTARIIIIAVTAHAMKGDEVAARDAGCVDYVTKPIDTRGLPGRIAAHLSERGLEGEI